MTCLALLLLAVQSPRVEDTEVWKQYQTRLKKAYMLDVRWTETSKDSTARSFRHLKMGDDRFLLEEVGVSRTVWNQDKGVEIDFAKKQYRKLSSKPAFVEAQFLHIAGQEGKDSYGMPRSVRVIRETKDDVEWLGIHVIYQPNIDAGLITTYWFDTKTSLISIHIDKYMPSGPEMTRRVKRFDLTPLLSSSDFSPNPPEGFVERNP